MLKITKAFVEIVAINVRPIINKIIIKDKAIFLEIEPDANGRNFFFGLCF